MTFSLINNPDPSRSIYAQRSYGYTFQAAAADIIDNSITEDGTTKVNIKIVLKSDGSRFVYFGDDGKGMDSNGLYAALTYGSPERTDPESLGKFGMGLKSASSSVCLVYTVITRTSKKGDLIKLGWDLEHVEKVKKWEMKQDAITEEEIEIFNEMCGASGTLVIWSNCDRLLPNEYQTTAGSAEKRALKSLATKLTKHVGTVYHRFLDDSDTSTKNIVITINGELVEPWDPFFKSHSEQVLAPEMQKIEIKLPNGSTHSAGILAWILPPRNDLEPEEQKKARITNAGQGFYIYREGRLICEGGWQGVFGGVEPHGSLLRIEFDFDHHLDQAFKIDVKKSKIDIDPGLSDYLKQLLSSSRRAAAERYRRTTQKNATSLSVDHGPANLGVAAITSAKKTTVEGTNSADQTALVSNNQGTKITIKTSVQSAVNPKTVSIEAVEDITSGDLWLPALRSPTAENYVPAVLLNKHHDFYQKIYLRAAANSYAVDGMDYLLWAFAVAEQNNSNEELEPMFQDIREEVSSNLKRLLRNTPTPTLEDLNGIEE